MATNRAEATLALCASQTTKGTQGCHRMHVDELSELQSSLLHLSY